MEMKNFLHLFFCLIIAFPKLLSLHIKPFPPIQPMSVCGNFHHHRQHQIRPRSVQICVSTLLFDIIESSCEKRAILILFTLLKISNSFHIIKEGALKALRWRKIARKLKCQSFCGFASSSSSLRQDTGLLWDIEMSMCVCVSSACARPDKPI